MGGGAGGGGSGMGGEQAKFSRTILSLLRLIKGTCPRFGGNFLTRFPLKLAENDAVGLVKRV